MHWQWNDNIHAKHDFTCTFETIHHIRDYKLIYTVNQRSGDSVFGIPSDLFFHQYVYKKMLADLRTQYQNLDVGHINYHVASLHVYERHYDLLEKVVKEYKENL
jgi:thymidylate synthase